MAPIGSPCSAVVSKPDLGAFDGLDGQIGAAGDGRLIPQAGGLHEADDLPRLVAGRGRPLGPGEAGVLQHGRLDRWACELAALGQLFADEPRDRVDTFPCRVDHQAGVAMRRRSTDIFPGHGLMPSAFAADDIVTVDLENPAAAGFELLQRPAGLAANQIIDRLCQSGLGGLADDGVEIMGVHAMLDQLACRPSGADAAELQHVEHQEQPGAMLLGGADQITHGLGADHRGLVDDPDRRLVGATRPDPADPAQMAGDGPAFGADGLAQASGRRSVVGAMAATSCPSPLAAPARAASTVLVLAVPAKP